MYCCDCRTVRLRGHNRNALLGRNLGVIHSPPTLPWPSGTAQVVDQGPFAQMLTSRAGRLPSVGAE
jgi:hypothetical protein